MIGVFRWIGLDGRYGGWFGGKSDKNSPIMMHTRYKSLLPWKVVSAITAEWRAEAAILKDESVSSGIYSCADSLEENSIDEVLTLWGWIVTKFNCLRDRK